MDLELLGYITSWAGLNLQCSIHPTALGMIGVSSRGVP